MFVILDTNYRTIKLGISIKANDKLRTSLVSKSDFEDIWNSMTLDIKIFILAKKDFIYFIVKIMSKDKCKAKIISLFNISTYPLIYNIKIIALG